MAQHAASFAFGPFQLLAARHELLAQGVPVAIGQRALDVLLVLVRRHGELVTKNELMSEVWPGVIVEENNLAVHISALRRILGKTADGKSYLQTVAGRGYRFVAPVMQDDVARLAAPPVPAAPPKDPPHNLPQLLTRLIGRGDALGLLQERLASHRLVTLTGAGGIGKTRLAIETGRQALSSYPDGVWFIDLAPIRGLVAALVAEVLGLSHAGGGESNLAAALKDRRLLVILDNCEHVIAESAALAEALIHTCPQVSILATSRERLAIAGESVFRVPSLPAPDANEDMTAQDARRFGAIEMFVERATALGEGFALTDQNAATVAAICRRVDGIPLAIELAAPRLRVLSERQLASGLDERFGLLTGGSRTAVPRHQTLQALIAWSYELLSGAEQQMLRRFAVCAGSTALASIAAITGGAAGQVLDLLTSLVEKSLIVADRRQDETRYRMPESTRYFALGQPAAEQTQEQEQERQRLHARHFVARFAQATRDWETTASEPWLARYGADVDNLRAALTFAFGPGGDRTLALELVGCSHVIWSELGLMLEHRHWVERARALVTADTPALTLARLLSWQSGDVKDADDPDDIDDALAAASLYRGLSDAFHEGKMLLRAGAGRLTQDDTGTRPDGESGEALLGAARALLAGFGPTKALAQCVSALASARLLAGDMAQAQALHGEALVITRGLAA